MRGRNRASVAFILITIFIDVLGFGVVIPVLPKLVAHLASPNPQVGDQVYGWFLAVYGLMQFVFAPVLGNLSDRYGRRSVILVSLAFAAVDYVLQAAAPTIGWLFLGRVIAGVTGANFTAATAYIADVTPPEDRAKSFALIGAAFGVGFIVGPAIGGLVGQYGARLPFWTAAILTSCNWLYGCFVLPESLTPENRRQFDWRRANPIGSLQLLARQRWILALAGASAFMNLAGQAPPSVWVLYTTQRFQWTARENGLTLAFTGFASIAVQGGLVRVLMNRLQEWRMLVFGIFFSAVGFLCLGLAWKGWMMYPAIAVWSLSFVSGSAIQSLISQAFGPDEQGASQSAFTSIASLTGVIGPPILTAVFAFFTLPSHVVFGAPFFLGAVFALSAGVCVAYAVRAYRLAHRGVMAEAE